ncbi:GNAT family protein [Streptomyces sp. H10-C2]|uniref:GNAT family N-acetyltransferase n=1 Tax=unclassified Streptomyces TaxID=2593676 RepID=UPI0024BB0C1B|nr:MULTISPECIES: GNAT family protein [unclassified Streptomyces]MDJ0343652.1 GNAT family protein [Streptomyces sp. PH10-H1]MDJ0373100.1 GNAT family protein [Streptomyces sp. H10-C2]
MEKSGFTREGVLRSFAFRDGRWRDVVHFSVLRDDIAPDGAPGQSSCGGPPA